MFCKLLAVLSKPQPVFWPNLDQNHVFWFNIRYTHWPTRTKKLFRKILKSTFNLAKNLPTIHLLHRIVCKEFFDICLKNRSFTVKKAYDILKNRFWRPWVRILGVNENPKPEYRFHRKCVLVEYNCFGVVKSDEGREKMYASSWYCLLV